MPAGPAGQGLDESATLIIASFHDHDLARHFQNALRYEGILSEIKIAKRMAQVYIDASDREEAGRIFDLHRARFPDRRQLALRFRHDYAIFLTLIVGVLGVTFLSGQLDGVEDYFVIAAFAVSGGLTGHLIDSLRYQFRRTGKFRMGLREFLVLISLPAVFIVLVTWIPKLVAR